MQFQKKPRHKISMDDKHPTQYEKELLKKLLHIEDVYRVLLTYDKPPHCLWDIRLSRNLREVITSSLNLFFISDTFLRFEDRNKKYLLPKVQDLIKILKYPSIPHPPRPINITIESKQHIGALNLLLRSVIDNLGYIGYYINKFSIHFVIWAFHKAYYILSHTYEKFNEKQLNTIINQLKGMEARLLPVANQINCKLFI